MTISEFETARAEKIMEENLRLLRAKISNRSLLDYTFKVEGQSVTLLEVRPHFREPSRKLEMPVAKATFVKKSGLWKLYWHRASGKWESYEPFPASRLLEEVLATVMADKHCCFFG